MSSKILGIDLGGTSVKLAILTEDGKIQQKWSIGTDILDGGKQIVPDIIQSIQHHFDLYQLTKDDFKGIGMGSPGAVNRKLGTVTGAFNLNWKDSQEVGKEIEDAIGLPFYIDNDANVAALGEKWMGAGADDPDVVFITLGTGVGGGVVMNGELIHGTAGSGGEIGHITIEPNGFECTCGKKGCLETVASASGVINLTRQYSEKFAGKSELKTLIDDGAEVTSKMVFDLAKEKDALAEMVVDQFAYYLGLACSHLGNILNPKYIIIGGGVSNAGEFLLEKVQKSFATYTFPNVRETTHVKLAELGNDAGVIGAGYLVKVNK
ncbi:ROK family glucokinase [Jeotgalibaca ciconiae]|uniref:Glucokinase n=1 Tax=Jeotgalibaca ciconiae TaxID=2496265 RepID=A0A3Q9BLK4_9LACT|nr:ROK family glucokinase [Jeotgalibaca ciconiae]AZP05261.1 ROK family glucokinase [Jeotgalibaca ciconiae]HJB22987.1 ROK family glucokinase [Candidatus Jeotgalibaca pullicola]